MKGQSRQKGMMKILHVTREIGSDVRYGLRKSLLPLIEGMEARGHTVRLLDQAACAAIPAGRFPRRVGRWLEQLATLYFGPSAHASMPLVSERVRVGWYAARLAADEGFTHVHCHDPVIAAAYRRFAPWYGASACWGITAHGFGRYVQRYEWVDVADSVLHFMQEWEFGAACTADWVIAPSQRGLSQMAVDLGLPKIPPRWHCVYHPRPSIIAHGREAARARLGLEAKESVIVAVGQIIPMKRFDLLLAAVACLDPVLRPTVIILGEGDSAALFAQAQTLGLAAKLRLEVTDDIGLYLAAADVYVSVSATESFGMANCEAMVAGLPAVCTAVGAVPEIVGDGAWLVGDAPQQIADAIATLLADSQIRAVWAERSRQRAETWPDAQEVTAAVEAIYSNAVVTGSDHGK